jgi:5'(3')-deoxyribonucleotidase
MDNFIAIGPNVSKLETIRQHNVDYMIDDSIRNLDQVSTDCFPIMYTQPWNAQTKRFLRANDFYGIVDIIRCKERLKKYEVE